MTIPKAEREKLRKYLQKLPSRTPLENVTTGDYVELLDALDEAEQEIERLRSGANNKLMSDEEREEFDRTLDEVQP